MADREKVISDIHDIINFVPIWKVEETLEEVLALLKEQEPVPPHHKCIGENYTLIYEKGTRFCPWCGRAVKWE